MKTNSSSVMITKKPLDKWNTSQRATETDPNIVTYDGTLMTTKLRRILRDHGERVSISNNIVLEILDAYCSKSKQLKSAQKRIAELEKELANSSSK